MDERIISKKLISARASLLRSYPFFGRLLLKLPLGLADCQTAFTDMRRIVFDPKFAERLSPEELEAVLIHEVLHCALKHCTRGGGKQSFIYNVACDIVVNSMILETYQKEALIIDGEALMHLAPDGTEGREHSAEEVYAQLMRMSPDEFEKNYGIGHKDNHDSWSELDGAILEDLWNHHLKKAASSCGVGSGIPTLLARYLKEVDHAPRTNWRQVLHDFIRFDRSDYDFQQPDKRYSAEVILPSFCENTDGGKVEDLWFLVDTSASVSDEAVSVAFQEIQQATEQIGSVSGMLSFFDYTVSAPTPFESVEDLLETKPIGGGGTSFHAIFEKLEESINDHEPIRLMVIITDGHAPFPEEEKALGIPVIWLMVDSDVIPPWGAWASICI